MEGGFFYLVYFYLMSSLDGIEYSVNGDGKNRRSCAGADIFLNSSSITNQTNTRYQRNVSKVKQSLP